MLECLGRPLLHNVATESQCARGLQNYLHSHLLEGSRPEQDRARAVQMERRLCKTLEVIGCSPGPGNLEDFNSDSVKNL